ncbi:MAG: sn-glycerol-1-phosphate dehydrogenase [Ruminococcaceae bacterium]|nr:sn-glycerol-1-phosphate dehydrogenase [Oscillospiraceae bacterium]
MVFQNEFQCSCGKLHKAMLDDVIIGKGVIKQLPQIVARYHAKKVFVFADPNTDRAAGNRVAEILRESGIAYTKYVFASAELEPDEKAVGSIMMHYDASCDLIVGVGSGVLNDIGKILAKISGNPYVIVGTAPSMDGYASASSSMARDGLKISLSTKSANVIIGDVEILKTAPVKMMVSGLGDMLAKYVSICEWRISNLLNGEYYCPTIANTVKAALKKCVENASGLLVRDEVAVEAVFEGLVLSGIAMNYAGISRPASGAEHYISHVWDMRGLEFGTPVDFHGIQCAIGTLYAAKIYEQIKKITPNREKALAYVQAFDLDAYNKDLKDFLGVAADSMIELEKKEKKYDKQAHAKRLEIILANWEEILKIIDEEIPSVAFLEKLMDEINAPKTAADIGIDESLVPMSFVTSKDIRDKYVLPRLVWDLGIMDELKF